MKDLNEIKADRSLHIISSGHDGLMGTCGGMCFVFSWGGGWEHLSVSYRHRCPTWEEMCSMKDKFFRKDECCVQYHPAEKDYINVSKYCLHIWKPINGKLLTPPKIFV